MSYQQRCAEACGWCREGAGSHPWDGKTVHPRHIDEPLRLSPVCTAPTKEAYITELLARAEAAEKALAEAREDGERLDWLERAQDLNTIEPGAGFPDGKWTIWRDGEIPSPHLGRGETLRAAIDAARGKEAPRA